MKRLSLFFSVALLTFGIGVALAWGSSLFFTFSSISYILPLPPALSVTEPSGNVQIKLQRVKKTEYGSYAEFHIVNGSSEALYYSGYSKDDHCSYRIKRGNFVEQKSPCWCGNGLAERRLSPGESATYQIGVSREVGKFEVGFDFQIGRARRKQTIWSNEVVISNSERCLTY